MGLLLYSPEVQLVVATDSGTYDVSSDIVDGSCQLVENGINSMSVTLLNRGRRYDRLFKPNDVFTLYLKRLSKLLIMTGYLDTVPFFSVWPRSVQVTGSSTLKSLQYRFWEPGNMSSYQLLNSMTSPTTAPNGKTAIGVSAYNDDGLAMMAVNLATEVGGWNKDQIHISSLPTKWVNDTTTLFDTISPALAADAQAAMGSVIGGGSGSPLQQGITTLQSALNGAPAGTDYPKSLMTAVAYVPTSADNTFGTTAGGYYCQTQWTYKLPDGSIPSGVVPATAKQFLSEHKLMVSNPDANLAVIVQPISWGPDTPSGGGQIGLSPKALEAVGLSDSGAVQLAWVTSMVVTVGPYVVTPPPPAPTVNNIYPTWGVRTKQQGPSQSVNLLMPQASGADVAVKTALAQVGKPYVWGATGPNSFDCLVAGTLITTDQGDVPIESIREGDLVRTRAGYHKVTRAWLVRPDADVMSVELASGRVLTGTADHRVWTENRGWVGLAHLTPRDTLVSCVRTDSVVRIIKGKQRMPVHDLSVEGQHEFFAQGVLVHNCSGLMVYSWGAAGVTIPRVTQGEYTALAHVPSPSSNWLPGDLLLYAGSDGTATSPGHVKMYIGNGSTVEAPYTGTNVQTGTVDTNGNPTGNSVVGVGGGDGVFCGCFRVTVNYAKAHPSGQTQTTTQSTAGAPTASAGGGANTSANTSSPIDYTNDLGSPDLLSTALTGFRAMLNDTPLLPMFQTIINGSMRSFTNAPNGDIIAWFPDYFNQYKCLGVVQIQDIELQDFTVSWSDQSLVTHQFVAGTSSPYGDVLSAGTVGGQVQYYNIVTTDGVATIDFPQILQTLFNITNNDPTFSTDALYRRFGARVNYQGIGTIVSNLAEFWYALYLFQQNWASMFSASIPIAFLPEVYPGMILQVPSVDFQCYVQKVTHSWNLDDGGGFTTSVDVVAPSSINAAGLWGFAQGGA